MNNEQKNSRKINMRQKPVQRKLAMLNERRLDSMRYSNHRLLNILKLRLTKETGI